MNATSRPKRLWALLAALTLLATATHTLALFTSMDHIGYFQKGSAWVTLFYVSIALIALLCITFSFLINYDATTRDDAPLSPSRFFAAAVAAALIAICALFLLLHAAQLPISIPITLLTTAFLLCGAIYFALHLANGSATTTALFGYGAILSAAFSLMLTYFDRYTQMNAPHKLSFHVCMLLVMFALLFEIRNLLGVPFPRLCTSFTAFTASFCTATALPNILAFLAGVYTDPLYLFFDLMTLGYAVYFGTKCAHCAISSFASGEVKQ